MPSSGCSHNSLQVRDQRAIPRSQLDSSAATVGSCGQRIAHHDFAVDIQLQLSRLPRCRRVPERRLRSPAAMASHTRVSRRSPATPYTELRASRDCLRPRATAIVAMLLPRQASPRSIKCIQRKCRRRVASNSDSPNCAGRPKLFRQLGSACGYDPAGLPMCEKPSGSINERSTSVSPLSALFPNPAPPIQPSGLLPAPAIVCRLRRSAARICTTASSLDRS